MEDQSLSASTQRYKDVIIGQTTTLWQHLDRITSDIPDDVNWDDLTDKQKTTVLNVIAVEKEWITDNDDWREASMFKFDDTDAD